MAENNSMNALLTDSQRQHLEERGDDSAARMARSRGRKRLYNALTTDMPILYEAIAEGHLDAGGVVDDGTDPHGVGTDELGHGLRDTVSLVYLLAEAAKLKPEKVIKEGMERGKDRFVESRIDELEEIYKSSNANELTIKELNLLVEEGRIDKQQRNEAVDRMLGKE